jgi:hypothetical protein
VEREHPGLVREPRVLIDELAGGAAQRPRIHRRAGGEGDRLLEEPGLFGGGEPLTLVARSRLEEVFEDLTGGLLRVPPGDGSERRQVAARLARSPYRRYACSASPDDSKISSQI